MFKPSGLLIDGLLHYVFTGRRFFCPEFESGRAVRGLYPYNDYIGVSLIKYGLSIREDLCFF